ncbi:MAG: hypothetical protein JWO40_881 [Candidatus Doudnabacteria bacterium]|nr:hypothetical protein [Candidatus Doudnabacteria bacterium]
MINNNFLISKASKPIIVSTALLALTYFISIAFFFPKGNPFVFALLAITQAFYLWMTLSFSFSIWKTETPVPLFNKRFARSVDVFITVAGEPLDIVRETVQAAKKMSYLNFKVYILNDGYVAKKDNWKEIIEMAKQEGVSCITRTKPGGAKAGNINHALSLTKAAYVVIFDADHVPHKDFLKKTMGYFEDPKMGFVQTPQYYKNFNRNDITKGAWEQQELFFGAICKGKNASNAAFMCGTNMVLNRAALTAAGGMNEENITEDFATSMKIHSLGWKSYYHGEVLAEGLAPEDFLSYYKQQLRWSRGSLEVLVQNNPLFVKGLSLRQKLQYIASASYYLSGIMVLINALLPLIFFFTGLAPLHVSTMTLATVFIIYMFLSIYTLSLSTNFSYTYTAVSFSLSSFAIFTRALFSTITRGKQNFSITSKTAIEGNFLNLVIPNILYIGVTIIGVVFAISRWGLTDGVVTNICWALFHCITFSVFIFAAMPKGFQQFNRIKKINLRTIKS